MEKQEVRGIIFDMDNTLLRSTINFRALRDDLASFFTVNDILSDDPSLFHHTSSTLMAAALSTGKMTDALVSDMWKICTVHEQRGMQDADLEPGVTNLLPQLQHRYHLAVVTNNSIHAAEAALQDNSIAGYFTCIVGREQMGSLKPAPDGFLYVLNKFRHLSPGEWISVGDAWIDGRASADAGIEFISYRGDSRKMAEMGVSPIAEISTMDHLLAFV